MCQGHDSGGGRIGASGGSTVQTTAGGSRPPVKWMVNDADPPFPATLVVGRADTGLNDAVPVTVTEADLVRYRRENRELEPERPERARDQGLPRWNPQTTDGGERGIGLGGSAHRCQRGGEEECTSPSPPRPVGAACSAPAVADGNRSFR